MAIIDSGIDDKYKSYCEKLVDCNEEEDTNDYTGHGTLMFKYIKDESLGVAPNVKVTVLKVSESSGKANISNLIKAISWCIQNDINVISISMSTSKNDKELHNVIKEAYKQGIHIFSAVSNESPFASYPADYEEVIGVYCWRKSSSESDEYLNIPLQKCKVYNGGIGNSQSTAVAAGMACYFLKEDNSENIEISNSELEMNIEKVFR